MLHLEAGCSVFVAAHTRWVGMSGVQGGEGKSRNMEMAVGQVLQGHMCHPLMRS